MCEVITQKNMWLRCFRQSSCFRNVGRVRRCNLWTTSSFDHQQSSTESHERAPSTLIKGSNTFTDGAPFLSRLYSTATTSPGDGVTASIDAVAECVKVAWRDGSDAQYPFLWLRDNCLCPRCYNESSMSRRLLMRDLDPQAAPAQVEVGLFAIFLFR